MTPTYVHALADRAYRRRGEGAIASILSAATHPAANQGELEAALETDPAMQAALADVLEYRPSAWVLEAELGEIDLRRTAFGLPPVPADGEPAHRACRAGLIGLCCSGGGIRSATFSLGVLQGLAELDLLRHVDYLSSVSGGGYIHQWLAAWIRRQDPTPADQTARPDIAGFNRVNAALVAPPHAADLTRDPAPIDWLRRYSNYLTPERGFFTVDTWAGIVTWLRNALLNQAVLVGALFLLLLVPQLLMMRAPTVPPEVPAATPFALAVAAGLLLVTVAGAFTSFYSAVPRRAGFSLDEVDVQQAVVMPALLAAVLATLVQQTVSDAAPASIVAPFVFAVGAILAALVAFGNGALTAYVIVHFDSWEKFQAIGRTRRMRQAPIVGAALGILAAATLAGVAGAAWATFVPGAVARVVARILNGRVDLARVEFVLLPPLYLLAPATGIIVLVGCLGRTFGNARREWLARLTGWAFLYSVAWIIVVGSAAFGAAVILWLAETAQKTGVSAFVSWAAVSLGGALAGTSGRSGPKQPREQDQTASLVSLNTLAIVGPYVFIAGMLLILGWATERVTALALAEPRLWFVVAALAVVALLLSWRVDINDFSMHAFYRDRLARCYLGASNTARHPNPFTGFDPDDADARTRIANLRPSRGYTGPYPIFCTTLNLIVGHELAWQERKGASFAFTPMFSGYDVPWLPPPRGRTRIRYSGFARTESYAYRPGGMHMATAAAISGAAVSPNWGYHTNPATAFLMTMFNVRLGWWLINPRLVEEDGATLGAADDAHPWPSPHFALSQLARELFGRIDDVSRYVYLTDGGHFDNMGLYELVRRRCRYLVICDGEQDGEVTFDGLAMAIRKCQTDFGVAIRLDTRPLLRAHGSRYSGRHVIVGTIRYPGELDPGIVVYLKATLTGDEPADIYSYEREHPAFPHDTTLNQWFTESQFESYRRLGRHIAITAFRPAAIDPAFAADSFFGHMHDLWYPATPEMEKYRAAHAARYDTLLHQLRTSDKAAGLLPLLLCAQGECCWRLPTGADREFAMGAAYEMFEFLWGVYNDLNFAETGNLDHPHARGWLEIVSRWGSVDVVADAWRRYGSTYADAFQLFVAAHVMPAAPQGGR